MLHKVSRDGIRGAEKNKKHDTPGVLFMGSSGIFKKGKVKYYKFYRVFGEVF